MLGMDTVGHCSDRYLIWEQVWPEAGKHALTDAAVKL